MDQFEKQEALKALVNITPVNANLPGCMALSEITGGKYSHIIKYGILVGDDVVAQAMKAHEGGKSSVAMNNQYPLFLGMWIIRINHPAKGVFISFGNSNGLFLESGFGMGAINLNLIGSPTAAEQLADLIIFFDPDQFLKLKPQWMIINIATTQCEYLRIPRNLEIEERMKPIPKTRKRRRKDPDQPPMPNPNDILQRQIKRKDAAPLLKSVYKKYKRDEKARNNMILESSCVSEEEALSKKTTTSSTTTMGKKTSTVLTEKQTPASVPEMVLAKTLVASSRLPSDGANTVPLLPEMLSQVPAKQEKQLPQSCHSYCDGEEDDEEVYTTTLANEDDEEAEDLFGDRSYLSDD